MIQNDQTLGAALSLVQCGKIVPKDLRVSLTSGVMTSMIADRIHKDHCHGQSMIQYCLKTQTRFLAVAQKCYPLISKSAMSTCWLWNMYPWSCVWLFSYKMYWVIIEQSKLELWCVPRKIPQGCPVQFTLIWSWWGEQTWIVLNIQCVFWNARFSFLAHPSCTSFDVNSINSRCLSVQI